MSILGTDVNRQCLARAREGRFEEWALRGLPEGLRRGCFTAVGREWHLAPEYRKGVSFQYHNLVTHPFPSLLHELADFDLILCRNVTIYFAPEIVRRLVDQFHRCLADGGWLVVGHAEPNVEWLRAFRTVKTPGQSCTSGRRRSRPRRTSRRPTSACRFRHLPSRFRRPPRCRERRHGPPPPGRVSLVVKIPASKSALSPRSSVTKSVNPVST